MEYFIPIDTQSVTGKRIFMMTAEPCVSVTVLAFNHGKYIRRTIQSVLDQTHQNLEVVIVNDGSTDDTAEVIGSFTDPRMRVFHQTNQGPSVAANRALSECRGKYIAIMAGDDLLPPNRIERQLAEYRKGGSRILFSQVEFIDEDNNSIATNYYKSNLTPAFGQAKVLRRLFDGEAPAFILTLFTETAILKGEGEYCDPALYQLQDYELMIRLAKKYDFCYQDEKLYRFRVRSGHVNLSGPDPEKLIRTRNELYLLMRDFFKGISVSLFKEIFPDLVRKPNFSTPVEYRCEQAFVLLKAPTSSVRLLGAERLYDLLKEEEGRATLEREYGFTHVTFAETIKTMDTEKMFLQTTCLYLDSGKGFNEKESIRRPVDHSLPSFRVRFPVSPSLRLHTVRWDPVEHLYCKVWLESIAYEDVSGQIIPLELEQVGSNGVLLPDGGYLFDTLDPWFFFPVDRLIAAVNVQGRWSCQLSEVEWNSEKLRGAGSLSQSIRRLLNDGAQKLRKLKKRSHIA
jgi:glycosyltransferase involved in cell wall biosynthesis